MDAKADVTTLSFYYILLARKDAFVAYVGKIKQESTVQSPIAELIVKIILVKVKCKRSKIQGRANNRNNNGTIQEKYSTRPTIKEQFWVNPLIHNINLYCGCTAPSPGTKTMEIIKMNTLY